MDRLDRQHSGRGRPQERVRQGPAWSPRVEPSVVGRQYLRRSIQGRLQAAQGHGLEPTPTPHRRRHRHIDEGFKTTSTTPTPARSTTFSVWATSSNSETTQFGAGVRRAGGRAATPRPRRRRYIQKEGSLHTFGSARPSRSGVLCSAFVRELTRSELTGVPAATPGWPV